MLRRAPIAPDRSGEPPRLAILTAVMKSLFSDPGSLAKAPPPTLERMQGHRARTGCQTGSTRVRQRLTLGGSPGRSRRSRMPFETDFRPLFRESDRQSMQSWLVLWSYDDVRDHAWDILERVEAERCRAMSPGSSRRSKCCVPGSSTGVHLDPTRLDGVPRVTPEGWIRSANDDSRP